MIFTSKRDIISEREMLRDLLEYICDKYNIDMNEESKKLEKVQAKNRHGKENYLPVTDKEQKIRLP